MPSSEQRPWIIRNTLSGVWLGVYYSTEQRAQAVAWLNNLSMKDGWAVEEVAS